ncbi:fimbrial subunit [Escherichia coli]|nr:hypothetical protein [Escherichia coli]GDN64513.1 fimbrial subunit [Escherichia coli]
MKKVFAKSLLVAAMFSVAGSALAVQKDICSGQVILATVLQ